MIRGSRRPANTTLNTPVTLHIVDKAHHVSKDEALQFLAKFINEKESMSEIDTSGLSSSTSQEIASGGVSSDTNVDTSLSSSLAQLKRVERDFKGLPPAVLEGDNDEQDAEKDEATNDLISKSATGGVKRKFADEEEEEGEEEEEEEEEEEDNKKEKKTKKEKKSKKSKKIKKSRSSDSE